MPKLTPDFTVGNNSHCLIHAGPVSDEVKDPQHDLVICTSGGNQMFHNKNGTKTEYINGTCEEVSGYNITQEGGIARKILAKNGDIHINADYGDIYLKARNVYIETSGDKNGGKSSGSFLVNANGQIILAGQDNVKIASGTNLCLSGKSKITLVGAQLISSGKFIDSGPVSTGDFISKFMAGNFQGLIEGMLQSCK